MRSDAFVTVYSPPKKSAIPFSVNMLSCGPRTHRSVTLLSYGILGVLRSAIFAGAVSHGSAELCRLPSIAVRRILRGQNFSPVETLPITDGISKPPDTARYALMPFTEPDDIKYEPSGRKYALFISALSVYKRNDIGAGNGDHRVAHKLHAHSRKRHFRGHRSRDRYRRRMFAIFMDSLSAQPETMNPRTDVRIFRYPEPW